MEYVEFECKTHLIDGVMEEFGANWICQKLDRYSFLAKMNVDINKFKTWFLNNKENVKIIKPSNLENM